MRRVNYTGELHPPQEHRNTMRCSTAALCRILLQAALAGIWCCCNKPPCAGMPAGVLALAGPRRTPVTHTHRLSGTEIIHLFLARQNSAISIEIALRKRSSRRHGRRRPTNTPIYAAQCRLVPPVRCSKGVNEARMAWVCDVRMLPQDGTTLHPLSPGAARSTWRPALPKQSAHDAAVHDRVPSTPATPAADRTTTPPRRRQAQV